MNTVSLGDVGTRSVWGTWEHGQSEGRVNTVSQGGTCEHGQSGGTCEHGQSGGGTCERGRSVGRSRFESHQGRQMEKGYFLYFSNNVIFISCFHGNLIPATGASKALLRMCIHVSSWESGARPCMVILTESDSPEAGGSKITH